MTQAAVGLTAEELAALARIAGLRLSCFSDGREYYSKGSSPVCRPDAFHPDQNWPHLGRVIEGMAASWSFGFGNSLTETGVEYWAEFTSPLADFRTQRQPTLPLAICRAALAAMKE